MRRWKLRGVVLSGHLCLAVLTIECVCSRVAHGGSQLEDLAIRAGFKILSQGDSSTDSRKQASAGVPFAKMTAVNRQRAFKIVEDCNQFRRLLELQYSVDPAIYQYLLRHPDVAVSTWRVMGISKFEMWQTGLMEYEAQAADGSEGMADILYLDAEQCVFVCDGRYHNPLLPKPLAAVALIWFRNSFEPAVDGSYLVTQKADVFVAFSSTGLSAVARMLTPVTNSLMDRNLYEVSLYASLMSRAVRDEPEWVIQVAQQMDGVLPQRRSELVNIARQPRRRIAAARSVSESPGDERERLLRSGISLFDPPGPQDFQPPQALTVVPKVPVPSVPQEQNKNAAPSAVSALAVTAMPDVSPSAAASSNPVSASSGSGSLPASTGTPAPGAMTSRIRTASSPRVISDGRTRIEIHPKPIASKVLPTSPASQKASSRTTSQNSGSESQDDDCFSLQPNIPPATLPRR